MNTSSKSKYLIIAAAAVLLLVIFLLLGNGDSSSMPLGRVERGDVIQRVTISGTIEPKRSTMVTPPYEGYVQKLFVKLGSPVRKGDPLVSISQSLQTGEQAYPIRASFDGIVVQLAKNEGQAVRPTDPKDFILRVDDLSEMFVFSNAPEIDITKIRKDQDVIVRASPILNRSYAGKVEEIALAANYREQWGGRSQVEYLVKIRIIDADNQIKSGMSALVDIVTAAKENVLVLPHEYVEKRGDLHFVTLENGRHQDIEVGMQNEVLVEVTKGLEEGQRVRQVDFLKTLDSADSP